MNISVRTSHAITIAAAALLLTVGSAGAGAYAGARWIDGHTIKPNSIPSNRIQAVDGHKVTRGTITRRQLARQSVTTGALTDSTVDALQPTVEYVDDRITVDLHITNAAYAMVPAPCPAGSRAVAGYVHGDRTALYDPGHDYVDTTTGAFMVRIWSPDDHVETYAHVQVMCLHPAAATTTP